MTDLTAEEGILIADKIRHVLNIYPKVSYSMMQIALGTNTNPKKWRLVLDMMVKEGEVTVESKCLRTPTQRMQTYAIIQFAE